MQLVVTGGNSFIGTVLTGWLLEASFDVVAIYRSKPGGLTTLAERHRNLRVIQVDLSRQEGFLQLPYRVDGIAHLAALCVGSSNRSEFIRSNVDGTERLLSYAIRAGASRIVYTSSLSVHGLLADPVVSVLTPVCDPDIYGASKFLGERLLASAETSIPSIAIRLPGVLGPGASRAWIPTIAKRMLKNQPVEIFNPDSAFNNSIHVDDLCALILSCLRGSGWKGFHAFPVGCTEPVAIRVLAERLRSKLGSQSSIVSCVPRQLAFTIDSSYAVEVFDYRPRTMLDCLDRYASEISIS